MGDIYVKVNISSFDYTECSTREEKDGRRRKGFKSYLVVRKEERLKQIYKSTRLRP